MLEAADDVTQGATKGNSGIIHAGFDDKPGSVRAKLCGKQARYVRPARPQPADWLRLAEARGSLEHDLALRDTLAGSEPACFVSAPRCQVLLGG